MKGFWRILEGVYWFYKLENKLTQYQSKGGARQPLWEEGWEQVGDSWVVREVCCVNSDFEIEILCYFIFVWWNIYLDYPGGDWYVRGGSKITFLGKTFSPLEIASPRHLKIHFKTVDGWRTLRVIWQVLVMFVNDTPSHPCYTPLNISKGATRKNYAIPGPKYVSESLSLKSGHLNFCIINSRVFFQALLFLYV